MVQLKMKIRAQSGVFQNAGTTLKLSANPSCAENLINSLPEKAMPNCNYLILDYSTSTTVNEARNFRNHALLSKM